MGDGLHNHSAKLCAVLFRTNQGHSAGQCTTYWLGNVQALELLLLRAKRAQQDGTEQRT